MTEHKVSPQQIYDLITQGQTLTPEQVAAIQAPEGPVASLVVAGAGSGKTELMSVRVLWLVANGYALPEQILGLTFTRKAAGELNKRIQKRLQQLHSTELWPEGLLLGAPTISTYNAYANSLFREYSMLIGLDAEATLLTEAGAFQTVRRILRDQATEFEDELVDQDHGLDRLVELVINLNQEMVENRVSASTVSQELDLLVDRLNQLPKKLGGSAEEKFDYLVKFFKKIEQTPLISKIAEKYRMVKHDEGFVDYADQIAFACDLVEKHPDLVVAEQRQRYSHVLLDEYQDTSFLQTKLLQGLFADHSVLAVGDPNQSIYGWRGASANNLASFGPAFGNGFGPHENQVKQFRLQTSWRNPKNVLTLANDLAKPLAIPPSYLKVHSQGEALEVAVLDSKPGATDGIIKIDYFETVQEEAEAVAAWFRQKFDETSELPTAAVLMRSRTHMGIFRDAIESQGIAAEALGLGGLLETPEIVDLVSALRVVHTPNSGSALIRLLAGPRWRIAAKDISALNQFARSLDRLDGPAVGEDQAYSPEDATSIVDALDRLLDERKSPLGQLSDEAFLRLKEAGEILRNLRTQVGLPLLEFTHRVMQELWLDIEVQANPKRVNPMANLEAFFERVASFASNNSMPTLGAFIEWLDYLAVKEKVEIPAVSKRRGVVQLLTIHGAKGLEWQYVAIPELRTEQKEDATGWITPGKLPHQLRGDADSLPQLRLLDLNVQKDFNQAQDVFKTEMSEHLERESRRVMYVAVTRPEDELFISGSYWKPGVKKAAAPNDYFQTMANTLAELGVIDRSEIERFNSGSKHEQQPIDARALTATWPLQPFGESHAKIFRQRAQEVTEAIGASPSGHRLEKSIELLLKEEAKRIANIYQVELPVRVPASNFHKYVHEFDEVVHNALRPMPEKPYQQSLTGTQFHGWLESEFGRGAIVDIDSLSEDDGESEDSVDIAQLKVNFANSEWAGLAPEAVELEIQVSIGSNTFICKLDAVYKTETGYQIVDWKTGAAPETEADVDIKGLQLALYRMAFSRYMGIPAEQISACLFYVTDNLVVRPKIKSEAEIIELWNSVLQKVQND